MDCLFVTLLSSLDILRWGGGVHLATNARAPPVRGRAHL